MRQLSWYNLSLSLYLSVLEFFFVKEVDSLLVRWNSCTRTNIWRWQEIKRANRRNARATWLFGHMFSAEDWYVVKLATSWNPSTRACTSRVGSRDEVSSVWRSARRRLRLERFVPLRVSSTSYTGALWYLTATRWRFQREKREPLKTGWDGRWEGGEGGRGREYEWAPEDYMNRAERRKFERSGGAFTFE